MKKADFSANNIGKVSLLNAYTKKVLATQTKYAEDSKEAVALNAFIENLTSKGYIGNNSTSLLRVLMLPCLAKSESEMFINLARTDASGKPMDWSPAAPSKYFLTDKGAYCGEVLNNFTADLGFKLDTSDVFVPATPIPGFSIIHYNYNEITNNPSARPFSQCQSGLIVNFNGISPSVGLGSSLVTATTSRTSVGKGFYAMSYADKNMLVNLNGVTEASVSVPDSNLTLGVNTTMANNNFLLLQGQSVAAARAESSLIAFGKALTASQMAELKGYVEELMNALSI